MILSVSAWEAYVEELLKESIESMRPAVPPLGVWPALNASARSQIGRFNNPNTENVRALIADSLGLELAELTIEGAASVRSANLSPPAPGAGHSDALVRMALRPAPP